MGTDAQPVPVTVARTSMYLADHLSTSELILWRWPDSADFATPFRVQDRDASGQLVKYISSGFSCPRAEIAESDWCAEWSDHRIQTGWLANGQIGFAWNAAQDRNPATPYPYVYAVFIDEPTLTVVDHWYIKSTEVAVQYPVFTPNARGDIGGLVLFGAGEGPAPDRPRQGFASCAAVVRDSASGEWNWVTQETLRSDNDPPLRSGASRPRVGDYLGAWAHGGNENTWSGGCMTYGADGTQVHFLQFGLRRDNPKSIASSAARRRAGPDSSRPRSWSAPFSRSQHAVPAIAVPHRRRRRPARQRRRWTAHLQAWTPVARRPFRRPRSHPKGRRRRNWLVIAKQWPGSVRISSSTGASHTPGLTERNMCPSRS